MPGRGDNNQAGSAGRGANNQSNQGFNEAGENRKSDHNKHAGGGKPSEPQRKDQDQSSNRNTSTERKKS